jgi:hypothetical protein
VTTTGILHGTGGFQVRGIHIDQREARAVASELLGQYRIST